MVAFVVWHGANLRVPGQFKGLYDCLAGTMRRGGPLAVYQGFVTSLVMFSIYRGTPPAAPPPTATRVGDGSLSIPRTAAGLYFGLYDTARDGVLPAQAALAAVPLPALKWGASPAPTTMMVI